MNERMTSAAADERRRRLAAALRENLRKRKARGRAADPAGTDAPAVEAKADGDGDSAS